MDKKCSVCYEEYSTQIPPIELTTCKHIFHEKCIKKWNAECGEGGKKTLCPECTVEYQQWNMKIRQDIMDLIVRNMLVIYCDGIINLAKIVMCQRSLLFNIILKSMDGSSTAIQVNFDQPMSIFYELVESETKIPKEKSVFQLGNKAFNMKTHSATTTMGEMNFHADAVIFQIKKFLGG